METNEEQMREFGQRLMAAAYARMSDDQQRKASIEDQFRNCGEGAHEKGFGILEGYMFKDEGKTGTTMFGRPGFAALRAAYKQKNRPFDVIVIDDTSRMGRNEADVYKVLDELDFYGVRIYFTSDGLDSSNPWFREAFAAKARQDAQFSKTLGKRVRRGRIGLFEKDLNPGWSCYGYRNELVRSDDPDARGRAASQGYREVIDPEEAKIVVLIFTWYASGLSLRQITVRLNDQGVKPPRATGRKTKSSTWARSAVDYILHNERYIGVLVYGRTTQVRNPENGKMVQRVHPESEWIKKERPRLRIIAPDLWAKVVAERDRRNTLGAVIIGGMTRTDNSRKYFLSSLLECGLCGAKYHLRAHGRYVCSGYQWRNSCPNCATFKRTEIEQALISALCNNLRRPALREDMVHSLFEYLNSEKANQAAGAEAVEARKAQLEVDRAAAEVHRANLLEAIKVGGDLQSLVNALAGTEAQIKRIDRILYDLGKSADVKDLSIDQVRAFVEEQISAFEAVLLGSAEMLKVEFQRRLRSALKVTPVDGSNGRMFRVSGDVGLFSLGLENGALLSDGVSPTGQQSTIAVNFRIPLYVPQKRKLKAA